MKKYIQLRYLAVLLIFFNILLASRWVIDGNLFFHTDIARDFLLMEDIVDNKHLTLIGPRSGAIPGLFHGPLWLYLNLPAFFISGGNPVSVAWFWVVLYVLSLFTIFYVGKRLFGEKEGMLAAILLSSVTVLFVRSLFNPYGALLLFPVFFYLFISYLQNQRLKTLTLALFTLGLIIQFQMAFGIPILLLSIIYLFYYFLKNKKLSHMISLPVILIPLSSFLLFDLRNGFIQAKSVVSYLWGFESHGKLNLNLFQLVVMRIKESVTDGLGMITQNSFYPTILLLVMLIAGIYLSCKRKNNNKNCLIYSVATFFYLGFWFFTIFFKGPVWNYYYLPFIPLLILIIVSFKNTAGKFIFYSFFIVIYFINMKTFLPDSLTYNQNVSEQDVSTWKFNQLVAQKVFNDTETEFGYFIFTPDLYGYSPRYALNFYQKKDQKKKVYPYQKKAVTYLVIAPPPVYGKDPNSIWFQKNTNSRIWKNNDVRIGKDPVSKEVFQNGFMIEKYNLSDEEIKIEPNPYLIKDIFFR